MLCTAPTRSESRLTQVCPCCNGCSDVFLIADSLFCCYFTHKCARPETCAGVVQSKAVAPMQSYQAPVLRPGPSNLPDWSIVVISQDIASYDLSHINFLRFVDEASTTRGMLCR